MRVKTAAKMIAVAALVTFTLSCKEMRQKNEIVRQYDVQIEQLYRAKDIAQKRHDSAFDAGVAEIKKRISADSALLASGNATSQDSFNVEFNGHLVYPVVVHDLKVGILKNVEKQEAFEQKIDSLATLRDATARSAYHGVNSLYDLILAGLIVVVLGVAAMAVVIAQNKERINAWARKLSGNGSKQE